MMILLSILFLTIPTINQASAVAKRALQQLPSPAAFTPRTQARLHYLQIRSRKQLAPLQMKLIDAACHDIGPTNPVKALTAEEVATQQLITAAQVGDVELVKNFINEKYNINGKDAFGRTALMHAVLHGQAAVVDLFVEADADLDTVDQEGRSLYMYLAKHTRASPYEFLESKTEQAA